MAMRKRELALATFAIATECDDHRDDSIPSSDLGAIVFYGDNGEDEFESVAVFEALSGGYIVALESSDYTGHGCQCSGSASRFTTLDEALRLGLSESEAELCNATKKRTLALKKVSKEVASDHQL